MTMSDFDKAFEKHKSIVKGRARIPQDRECQLCKTRQSRRITKKTKKGIKRTYMQWHRNLNGTGFLCDVCHDKITYQGKRNDN